MLLGKLAQALRRALVSSQGELVASHKVFSASKTEKYARSIDERHAEKAGTTGLYDAIELAPAGAERALAVEAWRKFVARQTKQYAVEPLPMGRCSAWRILNASERSTPRDCIMEALSAARIISRLDPAAKLTRDAGWCVADVSLSY